MHYTEYEVDHYLQNNGLSPERHCSPYGKPSDELWDWWNCSWILFCCTLWVSVCIVQVLILERILRQRCIQTELSFIVSVQYNSWSLWSLPIPYVDYHNAFDSFTSNGMRWYERCRRSKISPRAFPIIRMLKVQLFISWPTVYQTPKFGPHLSKLSWKQINKW